VNGALWQLKQLGAVDTAEGTKLTKLGHQMALLPLDPRFSKILLSAKVYGCLYVQLYINNVYLCVSIFIFTSFKRFFPNIQITTYSP
jgi:HrpA-like RNA helicase